MKKINEIFYSIQGEGFHAGTPAVFVRFTGCTLRCPFCDTEHQPHTLMGDDEILFQNEQYPAQWVILTGGEPSMFIDAEFVKMIHGTGKKVAVETNGTKVLPDNVDWVTVSPKSDFCKGAEIINQHIDELKVVYQEQDLTKHEAVEADHYFLQPCDYHDTQKNADNLKATITACLANPQWRISLQTQKILEVR